MKRYTALRKLHCVSRHFWETILKLFRSRVEKNYAWQEREARFFKAPHKFFLSIACDSLSICECLKSLGVSLRLIEWFTSQGCTTVHSSPQRSTSVHSSPQQSTREQSTTADSLSKDAETQKRSGCWQALHGGRVVAFHDKKTIELLPDHAAEGTWKDTPLHT